jgi:hypothetical protein
MDGQGRGIKQVIILLIHFSYENNYEISISHF